MVGCCGVFLHSYSTSFSFVLVCHLLDSILLSFCVLFFFHVCHLLADAPACPCYQVFATAAAPSFHLFLLSSSCATCLQMPMSAPAVECLLQQLLPFFTARHAEPGEVLVCSGQDCDELLFLEEVSGVGSGQDCDELLLLEEVSGVGGHRTGRAGMVRSPSSRDASEGGSW